MMSSKTIAEATCKLHVNVIRDIQAKLDGLDINHDADLRHDDSNGVIVSKASSGHDHSGRFIEIVRPDWFR
jgi:hypothetical protein